MRYAAALVLAVFAAGVAVADDDPVAECHDAFGKRDFDAAIAVAGESLRISPDGQTARLVTIAANWELGEYEQARQIGDRVLASDSTFSIKRFSELQPYRNPVDLQNYVTKIKSAGLTE